MEQTNRRPPSGVNLFDRSAIAAAVKAKMTEKENKAPGSMPLVSHIHRGYCGHTDGRSRTFKKHRRLELKASARRRARR